MVGPPEWLNQLLLNVAAGVMITGVVGFGTWVTWVSRKIPSFADGHKAILKALEGIEKRLEEMVELRNDLAEHEKDDAALFSDLRARTMGLEKEVFRRRRHVEHHTGNGAGH